MRVIILKVKKVTAPTTHGDRGRIKIPELRDMLAPRHRELARLMLRDLTAKQMAHKMGIAPTTVAMYWTRMRRKMKCRTLHGLMLALVRPEVITVDPPPGKDDLVLNRESRTVRRGRRKVTVGGAQYELIERLARSFGKEPVHVERLCLALYGGRDGLTNTDM